MGFDKDKTQKIWMNNKLIDWDDAKIHICSHVIHYGSALFEGIRCYKTKKGSAIYRLKEHTRRLFNSCKIYRMEAKYSENDVNNAIIETIKANGLEACYIRPIIYRGYGALGVNPFPCPVDVAIAVWKWGAYLGEEALAQGVDVKVSTWNRMAPNTMPAMAKAASNYMNSQLTKMEALVEGYEEGIALDPFGNVSEGSGENIFIIREGKILTPPLSSSILPGITRDTVITLAKELGIEIIETNVPREMLYIADEVFFTGSAAEITPIRSIDKIKVGPGKRGPITEKLQKAFFATVSGEVEDKRGWLTYIK